MIRFRIANLDPEQASQLRHPLLQRLAGRGPWTCTAGPAGDCIITRGGHDGPWGPWLAGPLGLEYALADPLPAWDDAWLIDHPAAVPVLLTNGLLLPVVPVPVDGFAVDILTGEIGQPVGAYGAAVADAYALVAESAPEQVNHPLLLAAVREILLRSIRLPLEAIHAYAVVGTKDLRPLVEAAGGIPKDQPGAGG